MNLSWGEMIVAIDQAEINLLLIDKHIGEYRRLECVDKARAVVKQLRAERKRMLERSDFMGRPHA